MKLVQYILFLPLFLNAQVQLKSTDSLTYEYLLIEGDSIAINAIELDEVLLLPKLKFNSKEERRKYYILKRKTIKVYPYAKLAAERLQTMQKRLESIPKKRLQKRYVKRVQKYIEEEFSEELKKMTRTEGQILIKLIHRQTGSTAFNLIKELRNGWRAFWFNSTANMFNISLKREFNPEHVKEDYLIEDILQRSFQNGILETQQPAFPIDIFALNQKWLVH